MKFFSSYSSGLSCSPEPFTFVSLLSLSLSRGDLFILSLLCHFVNPFFRFLLFLHFISLFLSLFVHFALLLCSLHTKSDSWASLSCHFGLFIIFWQKINSQNRSSVSYWRRHPDLNWGIKVLQTSALPLGYGTIFNCFLKGSDSKGIWTPVTAVKGRCLNRLTMEPGIKNSPCWTRTNDTAVNSRMLYRLS